MVVTWMLYDACIRQMHMSFPILSATIHSKKTILDVIKTCDGLDILDRNAKFNVFCRVCDNLLAEGRITKSNHTRWTEIV